MVEDFNIQLHLKAKVDLVDNINFNFVTKSINKPNIIHQFKTHFMDLQMPNFININLVNY